MTVQCQFLTVSGRFLEPVLVVLALLLVVSLLKEGVCLEFSLAKSTVAILVSTWRKPQRALYICFMTTVQQLLLPKW